MKFKAPSKLTRAALISLAALGAAAGAAFLTDDISIVQFINAILGPIGLIAAVLCGLAFANHVSNMSSQTRSSGVTTTVSFALIALLLVWVGRNLDSLTLWLWGGAAVAVVLAVLSSRYSRPGAAAPKGVRYLLIGGAFLGGALPGAILYFILALVVSDRYCQLTSSKCL